jgi:threonine aldolase
MQFASDNWAGVSEAVLETLSTAARRGGPAYGGDDLTRAVERRFAEVFEHEVAVFFVTTGTAANALALSAYARPGGVVFCHRGAHIAVDEAGATEFFGGGTKLFTLEGVAGKIAPPALAEAMARFPAGVVHHGQPIAVSVTQLTELGAAYRPDEIEALAQIAKGRGAALHMDGARFAGAVASLGASPADCTWRAGVDVLSFGGTKNGCLAAEAVVFFDPSHARDFGFTRQRAGQGVSKAWFLAAQFDAYLRDGHWLELARRANAAAARLASAVKTSPRRARLALEPAANELFIILPGSLDAELRAAGAVYHPWSAEGLPAEVRPGEGEGLVRLVTSFQTSADEIDRLSRLLGAPA